jgi:hypothetical protein
LFLICKMHVNGNDAISCIFLGIYWFWLNPTMHSHACWIQWTQNPSYSSSRFSSLVQAILSTNFIFFSQCKCLVTKQHATWHEPFSLYIPLNNTNTIYTSPKKSKFRLNFNPSPSLATSLSSYLLTRKWSRRRSTLVINSPLHLNTWPTLQWNNTRDPRA